MSESLARGASRLQRLAQHEMFQVIQALNTVPNTSTMENAVRKLREQAG